MKLFENHPPPPYHSLFDDLCDKVAIFLMACSARFPDPVMVLFEYIPFGDLLGYLRRSRGLSDNYYKDPDVKPSSSLSSKQLLKFSREIADGMAFLSANKVNRVVTNQF